MSPCLFNLYAEYILSNAEAQAGIMTGRNINNLRYADDTTLMAESEEELKSLLRKVKEESEKVGLKLNIQNQYPLGWTGWISLLSKGLLRVFSKTTVQMHHFFSTQLSLWSKSHIHT